MIRILLTAAGLYLAYAGLVFFLQRSMIFPRGVIPPFTDPVRPRDAEVLSIHTGTETVEAWFIPADTTFPGPCPAVIFAHGNAELIDFWPEYLKPLSRNGIHLLLVEYPGYGRSNGRPSEKSILRAFIAAYDQLVAKNTVDPNRIILFGRSIGGGAICGLAKARPSAGLILLSTFTSIRSFAPAYGLCPFLIRDPMDNIGVLKEYPRPTLILHGKQDELIPFTHAIELVAASRNARLIAYNCGHNDCPPDWNVFWKDVFAFLREHVMLNTNEILLK
ncbi:MAG: alpha/beta hydrolase [Pseudomonadota bacterium]